MISPTPIYKPERRQSPVEPTPEEQEFIEAYAAFTGIPQYGRRPVIVSTFDGNYGHAGWVFVINGSPPKGLVLAVAGSNDVEPFREMHARKFGKHAYLAVVNTGLYYAPPKHKRLHQAALALLRARGLLFLAGDDTHPANELAP